MHTNNCAAVARAKLSDWDLDEDVAFDLKRGEYEITEHGMWLVCPGCCTLTLLPFGVSEGHKPGGVHRWQLSGTPDKPTLTPSINHPGCWHGWLKDGQFTSC